MPDTELDEESLTRSTIDAVSFETIHNRRTPSLVLSPDCQTDESTSGDDGDASLTNASFVDNKVSSPNKRKVRKKSTFTNWRNLLEEKLTQGIQLSN